MESLVSRPTTRLRLHSLTSKKDRARIESDGEWQERFQTRMLEKKISRLAVNESWDSIKRTFGSSKSRASTSPLRNSKVSQRRTNSFILLHSLPPELWTLIFTPLLCNNTDGQVPNLIKALRPDRALYNEALFIFFKHNEYIFSQGNGWSFGTMSKKAVQRINNARIVIEPEIMLTGLWKLSISIASEGIPATAPPALISDATHLTHVTLDFHTSSPNPYQSLPPFAAFISHGGINYSLNYFLRLFERLRRADLVLSWCAEAVWPARGEKLADAIRMANSRLGVLAKLDRVTARCGRVDLERSYSGGLMKGSGGQERWFWEAEFGAVLGPVKAGV